MFEVRIHSRGGQGGVTAARLLATAALHDGKYATACPFYGAERRGAPVVSFVRIDDRPIRVYSQIRNPDLVVVLDASVMETVDVLNGLKKGGRVLVNSAHNQECNACGFCSMYCPDCAIDEELLVDLRFCKGCGICANECPKKAITMVREE